MERGRRSFPTATGWFFAKPRKDPRRPHPSRRAHAPSTLRSRRSTRAPQDEDKLAELRLVAEPFGEFPISRCQTAQVISFPRRICVRGLRLCFTHPEIEGWAERRETFGCVRSTRGACHSASKTRVNALTTRHARRLARRLASHNAGRSPLGAPPWRFFTRGRASVSGIASGSVQRAPGLPRRAVASRRRRTPRLAPPSGSSLEDAPR